MRQQVTHSQLVQIMQLHRNCFYDRRDLMRMKRHFLERGREKEWRKQLSMVESEVRHLRDQLLAQVPDDCLPLQMMQPLYRPLPKPSPPMKNKKRLRNGLLALVLTSFLVFGKEKRTPAAFFGSVAAVSGICLLIVYTFPAAPARDSREQNFNR